MRRVSLLVLAALTIQACGESHTIVGKPPFQRFEAGLSEARIEAFVDRSRAFSRAHGLGIDVNRFGEVRFSILIYDENLNLIAVNTTRRSRVEIDAISRREPTDTQRRLASAYQRAVAPLLSR